MRYALFLLVADLTLLLGCAQSPPAPFPVTSCSATEPAARATIDSANVRDLAGIFDIELLNAAGGWAPPQWRLRLSLQPTDSTPTYSFGMRPGPRPLQGEAVYASDSTGSQVKTVMVKLTLYIGPGIDGSHWRGNALTVSHFTADGFRGTWYHSGGIGVVIDQSTGQILPDPKGIFCARRRQDGGA